MNTEWIVRHYLAVKMILAATVMLTSLDYSKSKNLKMAKPYLIYYSLLTACRALFFTLPTAEWNNGELIKMKHQKIINITADTIAKFNKSIGVSLKDTLMETRDARELFSYRFPANGMGILGGKIINFNEAVDIAGLLCEIAQYNSEQLQYCIGRYYESKFFEIDKSFLKNGFLYKTEEGLIYDSEDWYRLDYIFRKQNVPLSLYLTMTEGMVEDFFSAWCSKEDDNSDEDVYNPDDNWRLIFPVP